MTDKATDVHQVKTYGSEKVSRAFLWLAAALVVVGMLGISTYDGSSGRVTIFSVMAAAGLAWGFWELAVRPSFPEKPLLELTPQGITLRTVGDVFIPWGEVRGVDTVDLTTWPGQTAPFPVKFKNLTVVLISRGFYDRAIIPGTTPLPSSAWDYTFLLKDPTVQVALHHDVLPVEPEELRREIAARWYAFRDEPRPAAPPPTATVKKVAFRINWKKK